MQRYENAIFLLDYNEFNDEVNEIIKVLNESYQRVFDFFKIKEIKKVYVVLWYDINQFHHFFEEKGYKLFDWIVGISSTLENENRIDALVLAERKKALNHQKDSLEDLKKMIIHEFVHACHRMINKGSIKTLSYISEGIAINLSGQYLDYEFLDSEITCTVDDLMLNHQVKYNQYYLIMRYILLNYSKEYVLKLANDLEYAKLETPRLFEEANSWLKNMNESYQFNRKE